MAKVNQDGRGGHSLVREKETDILLLVDIAGAQTNREMCLFINQMAYTCRSREKDPFMNSVCFGLVAL
jgi:hypothetical protein